MKTLTIKHDNGNKSVYKLIPDGNDLPIAYQKSTPDGVIQAIEEARRSRQRVKLYLGDIKTGQCWNESYDTTGTIGLSRGKDARYPLLINNTRSHGGGQISTHCIVKMTSNGRTIYQSPKFKQSNFEVRPCNGLPGYTHSLFVDGELYSNHKTERSANLLKNKLS
jgi:hypothetical protein